MLYKDADPDNRSFGLLHCWNLLQHAQKWKDLPVNSNNKKQKTSSTASPRLATPGTHESRHIDEEDGPSHTSPRKGRPDGQKKEKERRGKNPIVQGETLYMEAVGYSWSKREKSDELKELRKKERNDVRLALKTRRIEMKQHAQARKLDTPSVLTILDVLGCWAVSTILDVLALHSINLTGIPRQPCVRSLRLRARLLRCRRIQHVRAPRNSPAPRAYWCFLCPKE